MKITKNLILHQSSTHETKTRNLVILFSWLGAHDKPILKYVNFYLSKHLSVLVVKLSVLEGFWPVTGSQVIAEDLATFLDTNISDFDKILLHGFSVGAYVWGETLLKLENKTNSRLFKSKVVGQIWDSITYATDAAKGVAYVVAPNNKVLYYLILFTFGLLFKILYWQIPYHHFKACDFYHSNCLPVPALLFYSKSDEVGAYENNVIFQRNLEKAGAKVEVKCWDKSLHVSHFVRHPEEYTALWERFLENVGFWKT